MVIVFDDHIDPCAVDQSPKLVDYNNTSHLGGTRPPTSGYPVVQRATAHRLPQIASCFIVGSSFLADYFSQ